MPRPLNLRVRRTAAALALTLPMTLAATASADIKIHVPDAPVSWGHPIHVTGTTHDLARGGWLQLQFRRSGEDWRTVRSGRVHRRGRFGFALAPSGAGTVRVLAAPALASAVRRIAVREDVVVRARRFDVRPGHRALITGFLRPRGRGRLVRIQRHGPHGWVTVARDRTGTHGRFRTSFRARRSGALRIATRPNGTLPGARERVGRLRLLRGAVASWYGPGLYGNHLACGGRLTPATLGVANKSLPCGRRLTLHYRGRSVRVAVVDRGPYVGGREFDLTAATRRKLGFGSTGVVYVAA